MTAALIWRGHSHEVEGALEGAVQLEGVAVSTSQRLVGVFAERARAAAAHVSVVSTVADAADVISRCSQPAPSGSHVASSAVLSKYPGLRNTLSERGIRLEIAEEMADASSGPSDTAARLVGCVGIVAAANGVAETGSFLSVDDGLPARLLGMLADAVFALLPAGKILPGLDEMGSLISQLQRQGHRYVSLVTGPSRTADIERVLTIGVQGPKTVHVIVLAGEVDAKIW